MPSHAAIKTARLLTCFSTVDWGFTDYKEAFKRQLQWVHERRLGQRADALIFTEHYPVYTIGARKGTDPHLIWDDQQLRRQGIAVVHTNRGGAITYHGPGQLVGYPIVSLLKSKDLHAYLRLLESVLIAALQTFQLKAQRRQGKTGIWIENRKIAAIGIAARAWIAYHGFALNVNNALTAFQGIIPCGIPMDQGTITSMKTELGTTLEMADVKQRIAVAFWRLFSKTF